MPYVPEALPRVTPKALLKLTLRSFPRRVPRVPEYPRAGRIPPDAAELTTCPECLNVHHIREPSEQATCPETHPGRIRILPECATCPRVPKHIGTSRKPPSAPRAQRVRTSGSLRVCHVPRARFFTRMNSECDTCPEHRPLGYHPAAPRAIPGRPPPGARRV